MTEPDSLRVFVNGTGLTLARTASVIDAVRAFDGAAADENVRGERAVTDSRGLPLALDAIVSGGLVLRLVSARALRDDGAEA
jgi:hypothetical protein